MQASSSSFMDMLSAAEQVVSSTKLADEQKQVILGEMVLSLPPRQLCTTTKGTRDIVELKIQEAIDGFNTPKATSKKPIQKRAGKASPKSTKK